jgi:hypothetical protein
MYLQMKLQREPQFVLRAITGNETEHGINVEKSGQSLKKKNSGSTCWVKNTSKSGDTVSYCIRLEAIFLYFKENSMEQGVNKAITKKNTLWKLLGYITYVSLNPLLSK